MEILEFNFRKIGSELSRWLSNSSLLVVSRFQEMIPALRDKAQLYPSSQLCS